MLLEHERNYDLGMDALVTVCSCELNYDLGMDALVTVCFGSANGIMVWAWMLWSAYALGTRRALWVSARGARALGAGGAKLLVSPLITPIVVPYIISYIAHPKEFRLWLICVCTELLNGGA